MQKRHSERAEIKQVIDKGLEWGYHSSQEMARPKIGVLEDWDALCLKRLSYLD